MCIEYLTFYQFDTTNSFNMHEVATTFQYISFDSNAYYVGRRRRIQFRQIEFRNENGIYTTLSATIKKRLNCVWKSFPIHVGIVFNRCVSKCRKRIDFDSIFVFATRWRCRSYTHHKRNSMLHSARSWKAFSRVNLQFVFHCTIRLVVRVQCAVCAYKHLTREYVAVCEWVWCVRV